MGAGGAETAEERKKRHARNEEVSARERDVRERLIAFFRRASAEEARLTGGASPWSVAVDVLKGDYVPPAEPERRAWFAAQLSASIAAQRDGFTARRLARLVDDLAVGLAHAGPFEAFGDLAARLSDLVADAFPAAHAEPTR